MIKNYLKTAWRNLHRNRVSSFINITGLSVGMAVAMLIGLWIWDELSFNKYHRNYAAIAQVMENDTYNGTVHTQTAIPLPLDAAIRKSYGSDFKHIVMSSWTDPHVLVADDKKILYRGAFMGADAPEMFTLNMLKGTRRGLRDPAGILVSQSVAKALFGDAEPMNKTIMLDNKAGFKVAGVYEDLPPNTSLHDIAFMAPWDFYAGSPAWIQRDPTKWDDNSLFMYVQLADNADMARVSEKIKNLKADNAGLGKTKSKPSMFLQPMRKWHLYSEFKNGISTGGAVQYLWLFGITGTFVLLLACINFMNLSTARSEKRAKEVGIRKAIGSLRAQLISQFFCESMLMAVVALAVSFLLVLGTLPFFNGLTQKNISILWDKPLFWLACAGFTLFTGIIAGSYPALYLSSFRPVKVLKGVFKAGPYAAAPRKMLIVLQFTVSVILMIGTIVVYKQVQFAKNRPIGYSREGLISIETTNNDLHKQFKEVRTDLLKSGAIEEIAESSSPTTEVNYTRGDLDWKGKDPAANANFANIAVTTEYGKTVGWSLTEGRDFSPALLTDSTAVLLNEAAVKYMGLKYPVGETIRVGKRYLNVIGVVKDMVMQSPYQPAKQSIFYIGRGTFDDIIIKINPHSSAQSALSKIAAICKVYSPSVPFTYTFADDEYAKKFRAEERVGKLASFFASLAIFISCLGLFGMASFMAEQRTREIGVRKVLGASAFSLWGLLSKDFVRLVLVALLIAIPTAYYCMHHWLQNYQYRTDISWWISATAAAGAIVITILTVSFQAIKAALANPVKSLRTE